VADRIVMYGTPWCGDCFRARRYLDKQNVPYEYINIVTNRKAAAIVEQINGGNRSVPTIVFPDGSTLTEPSNDQIEAKLNTT
jgi:mycoredoxin